MTRRPCNTRDILVRGEPDPRHALHVANQLVENRDPRAVPDDVRMHREQEEPALASAPSNSGAKDLQHEEGEVYGRMAVARFMFKLGRVVLDPLDRELHDPGALTGID